MAPTADRSAHREATRRMRINAGIRTGSRPEAMADFGAAARRLRASNIWADAEPQDTALVVIDVRQTAADEDAGHRNAALAGRAASLLAAVQVEKRR